MATERLKGLGREARVEKRAAIRAAISEADEGAFISQDAMDAWIASWGSDAELPSPEPDIRIAPTNQ